MSGVPGYRSRGSGFDSQGQNLLCEVVSITRGPLSGSRLEEPKLWAVGTRFADHATFWPLKLVLISSTSDCLSVGVVRLRTKSCGVCLFCISYKTLCENLGSYGVKNAVFRYIAQCGFPYIRLFGGTCRLHLHCGKNPLDVNKFSILLVTANVFDSPRISVPLKRRFWQDAPRATYQKTALFIVTAMKASNLT
jgi:hypothetical protein